MLNTYVKNRGMTTTIVYDNNKNHINEINWDADYDGDIANLSLTAITNGKREHFDVSLDNNDLAEMLSLPSVNIPLHKRLEYDYIKPKRVITDSPNIDEIMSIFSPKSGEEFIVPITVDRKSSPKTHRGRRKSHVTYRAYKKHKSSSHRSTSRKSKTNSHHRSKKSRRTSYDL